MSDPVLEKLIQASCMKFQQPQGPDFVQLYHGLIVVAAIVLIFRLAIPPPVPPPMMSARAMPQPVPPPQPVQQYLGTPRSGIYNPFMLSY